jgi:hypothetical protein
MPSLRFRTGAFISSLMPSKPDLPRKLDIPLGWRHDAGMNESQNEARPSIAPRKRLFVENNRHPGRHESSPDNSLL